MAAYFSTLHPSEVKTMDAIILFDHKNYAYKCDDCDWSGSEFDLDVVSKIDFNLVCCPLCKSDDVRVNNENKKVG